MSSNQYKGILKIYKYPTKNKLNSFKIKMSTNSSVIDGTKLDLSKITFGKITRLSNGSKSVRVSYDNGPLTIQTPMMNIPWNVNPPYSEKDEKDKKDKKDTDFQSQPAADGKAKMSKWSLQMSFKGVDPKSKDPNVQRLNKFLENMRELDKLFLKTVVKNRQEWFDDNQKLSQDTAEAIYDRLYSKSIRDRVNKVTREAYPPSIDPKVNCVDGEFQCNVFTMSREKYDKPIDKINLKGTTGEGILRLTNFYIQQSRCGPTWTLMRLRADETAALSDFGFVDFDEEETKESKPKSNVQINDSDDEDEDDTKKTSGNAEDDSDEEDKKLKKDDDDDDDDDEEEEEEKIPSPPVVKKGVKKAAAATTTTKKK